MHMGQLIVFTDLQCPSTSQAHPRQQKLDHKRFRFDVTCECACLANQLCFTRPAWHARNFTTSKWKLNCSRDEGNILTVIACTSAKECASNSLPTHFEQDKSQNECNAGSAIHFVYLQMNSQLKIYSIYLQMNSQSSLPTQKNTPSTQTHKAAVKAICRGSSSSSLIIKFVWGISRRWILA